MRALLLALALTACAPPPPAKVEAPPEPPPISLTGTAWAMDMGGSADPRVEPPTIMFGAENRANGTTGCNQWFAQIDRDDGGLRFGAVGSTRRACADPAMTVERAFIALLGDTRAAQLDGGALVLLGAEAEELARFNRTR